MPPSAWWFSFLLPLLATCAFDDPSRAAGASLRLPATDSALFRDDPVASYRSATAPALEWLALHARGLTLAVRDGTIDLDVPGGSPLKLDAVTLDGRVSSDSVEMKVAAHGSLWRAARAHARFETDSLAAKLELEIDGLEAESLLERRFAASTVIVHPAATDVTLTAGTDGQRTATAQLTVTTPAFAISRKGARPLAPPRAGQTRHRQPLSGCGAKLGDCCHRPPAVSRCCPAQAAPCRHRFGAVDAGRARAAALAIADDSSLVRDVAAIVRGGTAVDLRVAAAVDDVAILSDLSAYDVSMGAEGASIEVPVPAMTLSGASGNVRIAPGVLTARGVAATFRRLESQRAAELEPRVPRRQPRCARSPRPSTSTLRKTTRVYCNCCAILRLPPSSVGSSRSLDVPRARYPSPGKASHCARFTT